MTNNTFKEIWDVLMKAQSIVMPLHIKPDEDCMCCATCMKDVLESYGKEVTLTSLDEPLYLEDLTESVEVKRVDFTDIEYSDYDVLLVLDIDRFTRLTHKNVLEKIENTIVINIDHHQGNTMLADYKYLEYTQVCSTSEILYDLFLENNIELTRYRASLLFAGLADDSGWFTYDPSPQTFDKAKDLMTKGAIPRSIRKSLLRSSAPVLKLLGRMLSRITTDDEHKLVYSWMEYKDFEELDLVGKQYKKGSDELKNIPGYLITCVFIEEEPGRIRVSIRCREGSFIDVSQIAAQFSGGGGHKYASGFTLYDMTIEQAKDAVIKAIEKTEILEK